MITKRFCCKVVKDREVVTKLGIYTAVIAMDYENKPYMQVWRRRYEDGSNLEIIATYEFNVGWTILK